MENYLFLRQKLTPRGRWKSYQNRMQGMGEAQTGRFLQKLMYECFFVQVHIASLPSSFLSECGIVSISLQRAHRAQCVVIRTPPWEVDQKYVYGIAGMSSSRPEGQIHDRTNTRYTHT